MRLPLTVTGNQTSTTARRALNVAHRGASAVSAENTLAAIRRAIELGSPGFAGERIPTLDEAIEVIGRGRAGLLLELKAPELYPGIVTDVVESMRRIPGYVESAVADRRLVVQSFNVAAMKEHKTHAPSVPVGLLGSPAREHLPVLGSWADQVNPSHLSVDRSYVDEVHRLGMECLVWTVNRAPAMKRALRMGVDGVITNRPQLLDRLRGA